MPTGRFSSPTSPCSRASRFCRFPRGSSASTSEGAAAITYGLTVTAGAICFTSLWFYAAIGRRLIAETAEQRVVDDLSRSAIPGIPVSAAATLVALWSPYVALALFAALALFYVLGSSLLGPD